MTDSRNLAARPAPTAPTSALTPLASAARRNGAIPVAERLVELRDWLADGLSSLHGLLGGVGAGEADLAWRAARHLLEQPGKRIRPLGVLLAARIGGRAVDDDVRQAALVAELAHAATLLHDDVIDHGAERRGAPTSRVLYGNGASVLGGDHLLVECLRRLDPLPRVLTSTLIETIGRMIHAEALQLDRRRRFDPDREVYLTVVEGKTAGLFEWALSAGGRLGGLDEAQVATLGRAGMALGMTFQLVDDLLDLTGDPTETGKDRCADVREGKLTWPLIIAAERNPEVALRLRAVAAADRDPTAEEAAALVEAIRSTGALDETRDEARRYADEAQRQLDKLPAGRARQALHTLVDAALERRK